MSIFDQKNNLLAAIKPAHQTKGNKLMLSHTCVIAVAGINCTSCLALAGTSIALMKTITWMNKPSLIIITIASLLNATTEMLHVLLKRDKSIPKILKLCSVVFSVVVFASGVAYCDQLFKNIQSTDRTHLIIGQFSMLLLVLLTSKPKLEEIFESDIAHGQKDDLEQQIEPSSLNMHKKIVLKASDQTLRPEFEWFSYSQMDNYIKKHNSEAASNSDSSKLTKFSCWMKKAREFSKQEKTYTQNEKSGHAKYVTRLSSIPDMSFFSNLDESNTHKQHGISLANLRSKEKTPEGLQQLEAEHHTLERISSVLLPPCLEAGASKHTDAASNIDEISSIPKETFTQQPSFKAHEHVKTVKVSSNPFFNDDSFSFPYPGTDDVIKEQKLMANSQKHVVPTQNYNTDTVEDLDRYLNSRKNSVYPDMEDTNIFQEKDFFNSTLNITSPKTLPPLKTSNLGLHGEFAHRYSKSQQMHSPSKSTTSAGSGLLANMFLQSSPTTSFKAKASSRRNSLKHKPSLSASSFATVRQVPFDNSKSSMSSPTRSTKGARLVNKLSLSNISLHSDTNTNTFSHNEHKRGKSIADFPYLSSLHHSHSHSPKKSMHSLRDRRMSNGSTIHLSFDMKDHIPTIKERDSQKRVQSGESAESGQTVESLDYPLALVSEYDKEKWRIMSEIDV